MKIKLMISACLIGINCRYDGKDNALEPSVIDQLNEHFDLVPACPEQLGGLSTPRLPSEIQEDGKVLRNDGLDLSREFLNGAQEAHKIAELSGCKTALLKSNSPSCGNEKVYDGNFKGILVKGKGVTAKLFDKKGIKVYNEKQIHELIKE